MRTTCIFIALAMVAAIFTSCDKIEGNPYETVTNPDNPLDGDTVKKVVLIDFTGHNCPNCPSGHAEIDILSSAYGTRFIPIGVHAGSFARPLNSTNPPMPADYRTPFGTALNGLLSVTTYPIGVLGTLDGTKKSTFGQWAEQVVVELAKPTTFSIELQCSISEGKITARSKIKNTDESVTYSNLRFYSLILEDSIVSPQKQPNNTIIADYVHKHVLRHGFTSHLGHDFELNANLEFSKTDTVSVNNIWRQNKLSLVVFIVNENNDILQAAYKHVD
jgi:thiol-disulfide isomerase/thioredoxin